MTVTKRIVYAPSNVNRTPLGMKVVPSNPDISFYRDKVLKGIDTDVYNEVSYNMEHDIPMDVAVNYTLPPEIGYIFVEGKHAYAVPTQRIHGFLSGFNVETTEDTMGIVISKVGRSIMVTGNDPTTEFDNIALIYAGHGKSLKEANLPIVKHFAIKTDWGTRVIQPKGFGLIPDLELVAPELLDCMNGAVLDVSRYTKYFK